MLKYLLLTGSALLLAITPQVMAAQNTLRLEFKVDGQPTRLTVTGDLTDDEEDLYALQNLEISDGYAEGSTLVDALASYGQTLSAPGRDPPIDMEEALKPLNISQAFIETLTTAKMDGLTVRRLTFRGLPNTVFLLPVDLFPKVGEQDVGLEVGDELQIDAITTTMPGVNLVVEAYWDVGRNGDIDGE